MIDLVSVNLSVRPDLGLQIHNLRYGHSHVMPTKPLLLSTHSVPVTGYTADRKTLMLCRFLY